MIYSIETCNLILHWVPFLWMWKKKFNNISHELMNLMAFFRLYHWLIHCIVFLNEMLRIEKNSICDKSNSTGENIILFFFSKYEPYICKRININTLPLYIHFVKRTKFLSSYFTEWAWAPKYTQLIFMTLCYSDILLNLHALVNTIQKQTYVKKRAETKFYKQIDSKWYFLCRLLIVFFVYQASSISLFI